MKITFNPATQQPQHGAGARVRQGGVKSPGDQKKGSVFTRLGVRKQSASSVDGKVHDCRNFLDGRTSRGQAYKFHPDREHAESARTGRDDGTSSFVAPGDIPSTEDASEKTDKDRSTLIKRRMELKQLLSKLPADQKPEEDDEPTDSGAVRKNVGSGDSSSSSSEDSSSGSESSSDAGERSSESGEIKSQSSRMKRVKKLVRPSEFFSNPRKLKPAVSKVTPQRERQRVLNSPLTDASMGQKDTRRNQPGSGERKRDKSSHHRPEVKQSRDRSNEFKQSGRSGMKVEGEHRTNWSDSDEASAQGANSSFSRYERQGRAVMGSQDRSGRSRYRAYDAEKSSLERTSSAHRIPRTDDDARRIQGPPRDLPKSMWSSSQASPSKQRRDARDSFPERDRSADRRGGMNNRRSMSSSFDSRARGREMEMRAERSQMEEDRYSRAGPGRSSGSGALDPYYQQQSSRREALYEGDRRNYRREAHRSRLLKHNPDILDPEYSSQLEREYLSEAKAIPPSLLELPPIMSSEQMDKERGRGDFSQRGDRSQKHQRYNLMSERYPSEGPAYSDRGGQSRLSRTDLSYDGRDIRRHRSRSPLVKTSQSRRELRDEHPVDYSEDNASKEAESKRLRESKKQSMEFQESREKAAHGAEDKCALDDKEARRQERRAEREKRKAEKQARREERQRKRELKKERALKREKKRKLLKEANEEADNDNNDNVEEDAMSSFEAPPEEERQVPNLSDHDAKPNKGESPIVSKEVGPSRVSMDRPLKAISPPLSPHPVGRSAWSVSPDRNEDDSTSKPAQREQRLKKGRSGGEISTQETLKAADNEDELEARRDALSSRRKKTHPDGNEEMVERKSQRQSVRSAERRGAKESVLSRSSARSRDSSAQRREGRHNTNSSPNRKSLDGLSARRHRGQKRSLVPDVRRGDEKRSLESGSSRSSSKVKGSSQSRAVESSGSEKDRRGRRQDRKSKTSRTRPERTRSIERKSGAHKTKSGVKDTPEKEHVSVPEVDSMSEAEKETTTKMDVDDSASAQNLSSDEADKTKGLLFMNEELEPISDEELENLMDSDDHSGRPKRIDVAEALSVNWASLVMDTRPKPEVLSSARERFLPARVLSKLGVAQEFLSPEAVRKVEQVCQQGTKNSGDGKEEPFKLLSPCAVFHESKMQEKLDRKDLLRNVGPYRRALSARRDLQMRRQLCRLTAQAEDGSAFESGIPYNEELYQKCLSVYRECVDAV